MVTRIINYNLSGKAWKGGCVPSRPVDFPTSYFKSQGVEFVNWDDLIDLSENDILLVEWDIFLLNDFKNKFPNNRIIVGGPEAFNTQFKDAYVDDDRLFYIYSNIPEHSIKNAVFFSEFWWLLSFFHYTYYQPLDFNHHTLVPPKKFFMPCHSTKNREWRIEVFGALIDHIDDAIYSRGDLGIRLPFIETPEKYDLFSLMTNDIKWYESTHFSIVLETYVDESHGIFVTEKMFKPISAGHPFMVLGSPNYLGTLKEFGFETFDNLFDESYDNIISHKSKIREKIKLIKKNVDNYDYSKSYDKLTLEKMLHNRMRFFDSNYLKNCYINKLANPILQWIEK